VLPHYHLRHREAVVGLVALRRDGEIRRGLAGLSFEQAEAVLLHHEWGFTFDEIAGIVGVSAAAARARASRGIAGLRGALIVLQKVRT
jgi:RNA polymerase sigma-70 factor, ECF subfamily